MTATWRAVARKDFEDAVRSKLLWGLIAVFVAFLLLALPTAEQMFPETSTVDAEKALSGVAMLSQLFLPGIALVVGYMSVTGERRSGSLRVLLSYPFSRGEFVAGTLAGRLVVTGTALTASYVVASGLVVALYGAPDPGSFLGFVGASVLVGLSFTGFAVGGSAAASTRGRAMALTIVPWVAMVFFWKPVVAGLYLLVEGELPGVRAEEWYFLLKRLNPLESFRVLAGEALGEPVQAVPRIPVEDIPVDVTPAELGLSTRLGGEVPVYLEPWVAVVVLVAWGLVPVLIGYWQFEGSDLD